MTIHLKQLPISRRVSLGDIYRDRLNFIEGIYNDLTALVNTWGASVQKRTTSDLSTPDIVTDLSISMIETPPITDQFKYKSSPGRLQTVDNITLLLLSLFDNPTLTSEDNNIQEGFESDQIFQVLLELKTPPSEDVNESNIAVAEGILQTLSKKMDTLSSEMNLYLQISRQAELTKSSSSSICSDEVLSLELKSPASKSPASIGSSLSSSIDLSDLMDSNKPLYKKFEGLAGWCKKERSNHILTRSLQLDNNQSFEETGLSGRETVLAGSRSTSVSPSLSTSTVKDNPCKELLDQIKLLIKYKKEENLTEVVDKILNQKFNELVALIQYADVDNIIDSIEDLLLIISSLKPLKEKAFEASRDNNNLLSVTNWNKFLNLQLRSFPQSEPELKTVLLSQFRSSLELTDKLPSSKLHRYDVPAHFRDPKKPSLDLTISFDQMIDVATCALEEMYMSQSKAHHHKWADCFDENFKFIQRVILKYSMSDVHLEQEMLRSLKKSFDNVQKLMENNPKPEAVKPKHVQFATITRPVATFPQPFFAGSNYSYNLNGFQQSGYPQRGYQQNSNQQREYEQPIKYQQNGNLKHGYLQPIRYQQNTYHQRGDLQPYGYQQSGYQQPSRYQNFPASFYNQRPSYQQVVPTYRYS